MDLDPKFVARIVNRYGIEVDDELVKIDDQIAYMKELYNGGQDFTEISKRLGIDYDRVKYILTKKYLFALRGWTLGGTV